LTGVDSDATRKLGPDDATVVRRGPPPVVKSSRAPLIGALAAVVVGIAGAGWYFVLGPGKPAPVATEQPAVTAATSGPNEPIEASEEKVEQPATTTQTNEEEKKDAPEAPIVATTSPAPELPEAGVRIAEPEKIPEEEILDGLGIPADVQNFRKSHIGGTLGGYIVKRDQFVECRRTKCPDEQKLMLEAIAYQKGSWKNPLDCEGAACLYTGTLNVTNPQFLDRPDCRYLVELTEVFRYPDGERSQVRTYCTDNGFNRRVETAGPVTTPQKMG
jgi:hypothetical protein